VLRPSGRKVGYPRLVRVGCDGFTSSPRNFADSRWRCRTRVERFTSLFTDGLSVVPALV